MKYIFYSLILFSFFLSATADEFPEYLQELREDYENKMTIFAVSDDDFEDDDGKEYFVLKLCSRQDDNNKEIKLNYLMRVTVQLTDRKTQTVVFAQTDTKGRPIRTMNYYAGRTEWEFRIPFGEMKKPKLTAYAIEFGFKQDGYFVPVAVEYDKVDSAEEILTGGGSEVKMSSQKPQHRWFGD